MRWPPCLPCDLAAHCPVVDCTRGWNSALGAARADRRSASSAQRAGGRAHPMPRRLASFPLGRQTSEFAALTRARRSGPKSHRTRLRSARRVVSRLLTGLGDQELMTARFERFEPDGFRRGFVVQGCTLPFLAYWLRRFESRSIRCNGGDHCVTARPLPSFRSRTRTLGARRQHRRARSPCSILQLPRRWCPPSVQVAVAAFCIALREVHGALLSCLFLCLRLDCSVLLLCVSVFLLQCLARTPSIQEDSRLLP